MVSYMVIFRCTSQPDRSSVLEADLRSVSGKIRDGVVTVGIHCRTPYGGWANTALYYLLLLLGRCSLAALPTCTVLVLAIYYRISPTDQHPGPNGGKDR